MAPYVHGFIRSALVWLAVGLALGVAMAFVQVALGWRPAHMHANLLGFVSMMIFGVAYHVIPRFAGAPLHRPSLARAPSSSTISGAHWTRRRAPAGWCWPAGRRIPRRRPERDETHA
ncbi:MAG TPA: hypothetical protein VMK65_05305 [Longimicrobiales bacterium]|nr:hypothetical protein [Longimicrobiales bacterium]